VVAAATSARAGSRTDATRWRGIACGTPRFFPERHEVQHEFSHGPFHALRSRRGHRRLSTGHGRVETLRDELASKSHRVHPIGTAADGRALSPESVAIRPRASAKRLPQITQSSRRTRCVIRRAHACPQREPQGKSNGLQHRDDYGPAKKAGKKRRNGKSSSTAAHSLAVSHQSP